ncbi:MAG TPA: DUF3857 domain-containing protein [Steroidobacteraceae bacterium]|nr:DUF3857 domain-containing protein [Steroidobacteraceae bacterium]
MFEADGSDLYTQYFLYKILSPAAAQRWKQLAIEWSPWRDEKPTMRARVITADGKEYKLDQATIADSPAHVGDPTLYGDARSLRAPLPAVAPGAVVETQIVLRERPPFAGAGKVGRSIFQMDDPIQHFRLTLQAPKTLSLRYRLDLLPRLSPAHSEESGSERWVFDSGPIPAGEDVPPGLPADVATYPMVTFSTGSSWRVLAEEYYKIVAARLAEADVNELVARLTKGRSTREAKAEAIIEYLNQEIRYTGIEFDQASVVPHSVAETLSRKYGDCKDKSLLLVAMLRAAGIPANVALLNAGERMDVPGELPGIGLFDHVIVYVPGDPVLWVDATDEYARLGQLRDDDHGRQALIVAPDTAALTRVIEARSVDNVVYEEREIRLAEHGPAQITEVSRPRGNYESAYRREFADVNEKGTKENLTNYIKSQYVAERLDRVDRSNPKDFSQPFRLTVESARARRGDTGLSEAAVYIPLGGLFSGLPESLSTREPTDEENAKATRPAKRRVADYELRRPFVSEWHYRIVPPSGFQPGALPTDVNRTLGPAAFAEHFSADADGVVHAALRFDTVQRRFTPAEQSALRNSVAELLAAEAIGIKFDLKAQLLLEKGQPRESFQAYRELIRQQPKDAIQHMRRANALMTAGMGEAARAEATLAVRLDPKSAFAQQTLATMLEYDLIGRQFEPGMDHAGAARAFRAAIALDPQDKVLVGNYAILLEYDPQGVRYGLGADLHGAIAEYRKLTQSELAEIGLEHNLAFALFYSGDCAAAIQSAIESGTPPLSLTVACDARLKGIPQALDEARRGTSGEVKFKETATAAGRLLMQVRSYPTAAALLEAGASGADTARTLGLVAVLREVKQHEDLTSSNTPEGVVRRMLVAVMQGPPSLETLDVFSSRNALVARRGLTTEEREDAMRALGGVRSVAKRGGLPLDVLIDISLQAIQIKSTGDDTGGYRETIQIPGRANEINYVVKENGQYKVLDAGENQVALALEVLERVGRQDFAGAGRLLGWAREGVPNGDNDDPYAGNPFVRFWAPAQREGDARALTLAAASLLVQSPGTAQRGVALLEQAKATGPGDGGSESIDIALVVGYQQLRNHDSALRVATALSLRNPQSKSAFHAESSELRALQRFGEADELARRRLQAAPDDVDALRSLVLTRAAQHDYGAAYAQGLKVVANGSSVPQDMNQLAWVSLFFDRPGGPDVETAVRAAQLAGNSPSVLHTLGCVYAEAGKTREARATLLQSMDARNLVQPNSVFWYGFGRIAEQYGEREIALADYAKVTAPADPALEYDSTYRLAQNRKRALTGAN